MRDWVPGRQWLVVAACVGVAALPPRLREGLRGKLLDLTTRVPAAAPEAPPDASPATARERDLANRVAQLEDERAGLQRDLERLGESRESIAASNELHLVPAEAIPLTAPSDALRRLALGRGTRDGVQTGAPVLDGSALVGLIVQATRDRSEVRLATDPMFRLRATDARTRTDGVMRGTGGALLVFEPAPSPDGDPGSALREGDAIVVSRASTICGLPAVVGTIRSIERAPGEGHRRALVEPAAELAHLERVVVVQRDGEGERSP